MKKTVLKICSLALVLSLLLPLGSCGRPKEFEISVLSQNLRITASDGAENEIMLRSERFLELIDQYQPDLMGLQEFDPSWDFFLYSELQDRGYELLYEYRGPGSFEATPIAYKTDKFELLEEKYFWLSDTARINSSLLLHNWVKEKYADIPVILTGDFNM